MANWRIVRVTDEQNGVAVLDCLDPGRAVLVTLEDKESGLVSTINICRDLPDPTGCNLCRGLAIAGFTPNDWTETCPPE